MMRRVLVLGSGFTSGPLVEYLTRDGSVAVTVASNILDQAEQLASTYQNTTATSVDVHSEDNLKKLIPNHELVVSYVPFSLHHLVARQCVDHKVHMVTSSYVSPAMKAFHEPALKAGVTLMNEIGLDPGIDHMLAVDCFDEVHSRGGKVVSFQSWCGGLPAPECNNNPLKYKFSWSPKSVLLAATSPASFLKDGKVYEVAAGGAIMDEASPFDQVPGLELEKYYNRDSTKYVDTYNIPEVQTLIRGTLRYKGFCSILVGLRKLGLLNATEHQRLLPGAAQLRWKDLLAILIAQSDIRQPNLRASVLQAVGGDEAVVAAIENLGLLSDELVELAGTPIDALCCHLLQRLQYAPGERDAIFLHHFIGIQWPDNSKEMRHIDLTMYGTPNGFTAMAKTVGKPTAIAVKMILSSELSKRRIVTPTTADIYRPILDKLKDEGITAVTTVTKE